MTDSEAGPEHGNATGGMERRTCLWCGDLIPDEVLFIDEGAECCSPECMGEYGTQLLINFHDGNADTGVEHDE